MSIARMFDPAPAPVFDPEKLQETISLCRDILVDREDFELNERSYKLKIASNIAAVLHAAGYGGDTRAALARAFGKPNNLTTWQANDRVLRWVRENPWAAEQALAVFTRSELPVEERVNRFLDELPPPVVSGLGTRLMLASFFLFGSDPEHLVPYRSTAFDAAEKLLGWPPPERGWSPGEIYAHHLTFVRELEIHLRVAGLDVRDTLDVQCLLWWLTKGDAPQFAAWRGEMAVNARLEQAIRDYEGEMAGAEATELERRREELRQMMPEFQRLFGNREALAQLQPADFFRFFNRVDARGRDGRGLFTVGLSMPNDPAKEAYRALEQDMPAFRVALQELLFGEGPPASRIDRALAGARVRRYLTPGLGIASALLFFQDPSVFSGTLYMEQKEARLHAANALPELPADASVGERYAAYESALVQLPRHYGRKWDWAQRRGFYWSESFMRNLGQGHRTDDLDALVAQFRAETGYPSHAHEADLAARAGFATVLTEDSLEVMDWKHLKFIASSHQYGAPGPQAGFNRYINNSGEEGRARLRDAIRHLLYSDEPLEQRLGDVLEGEYRVENFGESVATKLLSIVHPDRVLPIFVTAGAKGKLALMRHPALGLPSLIEGNRAEVAVRANDMLRDRLEPFFGDDTYGMKEFLYWLKLRVRPPSPGEDGIAGLADRLLLDERWIREVLELLRDRKQIILYGPPGTGKTFIAREIMKLLAPEESRRAVVQFHPNYSYEDFVQGYRPYTQESGALLYELKPGPLMRLAEDAQEASRGVDHVMVIDEINRGNLPKIFGELLYLLEYREDEITLMYGEEGVPFGLPENLLIIGTMNTADRSVGLIDAALRRRFHFIPLFPGEYPLDRFLERWLEANRPEMRWVADVVDLLNAKLRERFGAHLQVGHSHFVSKGLTEPGLERIWRYNVMPFLEDQLFGREGELQSFALSALRHELTADDPSAGVPEQGRAPLQG